MEISEADILRLLSDVIGLDESRLDMDVSMETIPEWDSLRQLSLILTIEDRFEREIPDDEVEYLTSARRIHEWLSE